ncbi:MAG: Flp pilus assembly protein CpaB [Planctomycetota bacterium]
MSKPWPFILALVTAVVSFALLKVQESRREGEILGDMVTVVSAEMEILPGDTLTRENLMPLEVPRRFLTDKTLLASDVPQLLGQKAVRKVPKGSQLTHDDLAEYRMHLSDDVPKGRRAFTISLDPTGTQAGQLRPGDRVDVIGVFDESEGARARTLLQNIGVMAIGGRRLDGILEDSSTDVTLDLDPSQCETLALAVGLGRLTLSLRNPQDAGSASLPGATERALRRE